MAIQISAETERLIKERVVSGGYTGPAEVLRAALEALEQSDTDLAKIREAVDDLQAGDDGVPLDEAFQLIREGRLGR